MPVLSRPADGVAGVGRRRLVSQLRGFRGLADAIRMRCPDRLRVRCQRRNRRVELKVKVREDLHTQRRLTPVVPTARPAPPRRAVRPAGRRGTAAAVGSRAGRRSCSSAGRVRFGGWDRIYILSQRHRHAEPATSLSRIFFLTGTGKRPVPVVRGAIMVERANTTMLENEVARALPAG